MHLELKRTDRVRHAFEIIGLSMRKVIHRIDVPCVSGTMMRMRGDDTIHDRITEMHVGVCHVDLRTQNHLAFLYLAPLHCLEETQVLLDRTITVRRSHTGLGRRTFLLRNLLGCLFIHIGFAFFDETDSVAGFVSSKRRLQTPLYFSAIPKSIHIALTCPICRYPFGSGGKRV